MESILSEVLGHIYKLIQKHYKEAEYMTDVQFITYIHMFIEYWCASRGYDALVISKSVYDTIAIMNEMDGQFKLEE